MFREPNYVQQDLFMIYCVLRIGIFRITFCVLRIGIFRITFCVLRIHQQARLRIAYCK